MSRDSLNYARGCVVLAVLNGALAAYHLWRALQPGSDAWFDAISWTGIALVWTLLATLAFRRARRRG